MLCLNACSQITQVPIEIVKKFLFFFLYGEYTVVHFPNENKIMKISDTTKGWNDGGLDDGRNRIARWLPFLCRRGETCLCKKKMLAH